MFALFYKKQKLYVICFFFKYIWWNLLFGLSVACFLCLIFWVVFHHIIIPVCYCDEAFFNYIFPIKTANLYIAFFHHHILAYPLFKRFYRLFIVHLRLKTIFCCMQKVTILCMNQYLKSQECLITMSKHTCFEFVINYLTMNNSSSVSTLFSSCIIARSVLAFRYQNDIVLACVLRLLCITEQDCVSDYK